MEEVRLDEGKHTSGDAHITVLDTSSGAIGRFWAGAGAAASAARQAAVAHREDVGVRGDMRAR